jgi:hypothetical protein
MSRSSDWHTRVVPLAFLARRFSTHNRRGGAVLASRALPAEVWSVLCSPHLLPSFGHKSAARLSLISATPYGALSLVGRMYPLCMSQFRGQLVLCRGVLHSLWLPVATSTTIASGSSGGAAVAAYGLARGLFLPVAVRHDHCGVRPGHGLAMAWLGESALPTPCVCTALQNQALFNL